MVIFLSENRLQVVCILVEGYPPEFMSFQNLRTMILLGNRVCADIIS